MIVYLNPVNNCNICGVEFGEQEPMYDCRILPYSSWANVCGCCFEELGLKLGTGYGQKYELQDLPAELADDIKRAWVKVEG